jgi:hypothetical protein
MASHLSGSRSGSGPSSQRRRRRRGGVERLEPRTLLAGTATLGSDGTLSILGTADNDFVTYGLSSKPNRLSVTINGASSDFRIDQVQRISATLLDGNDILQTTPLFPVSVDFGTGDSDQIQLDATPGDDLIHVAQDRVTIGSLTYALGAGCDQIHIYASNGGTDTLRLEDSAAGAAAGTADVFFLAGGGNDLFDAHAYGLQDYVLLTPRDHEPVYSTDSDLLDP